MQIFDLYFGHTFPILYGDIWADTTLANNALKWKAKYNLADMLLTAWEWQKAMQGK